MTVPEQAREDDLLIEADAVSESIGPPGKRGMWSANDSLRAQQVIPALAARLRAVLEERDEAIASEAEIRRQHTVVMAAIKDNGLPDGYTEWRDEDYRQWDIRLERVVECPACAFTFGVGRTVDKVGGYTCPNCAEDDLKADLLRAEEALRQLLQAAENETAKKTTPGSKTTEEWAAVDLAKGHQVPGVERRILLARAVLKARAALSPEGQPE